jgi:hypothetical protein
MAEHNDKREPALFSAVQKWLDARVPAKWHAWIWFVFLAMSGLAVTALVAYSIRIILGIGGS